MDGRRTVEIVGGPRDGERCSVGRSDVLIIPEPSMSIVDWVEDLYPKTGDPMPTFREVRYTVMNWHGRLCAVHPGAMRLR